jgi:predicted transposase YbfD/YdcC
MVISKTSVVSFFSEVEDPRSRECLHDFYDILTIAICCAICGLDEWEDMVIFTEIHYSWLLDRLGLNLKNGIPSEATFRRILIAIDADKFELCFIKWAAAFRKIIHGDIIAIDGKTVRGSRKKNLDQKGIHLLNVWSYENGVVLAQRVVDKKTNEITTIPEILEMLFLEGCTVTTDAMGCQKEIAALIIEKKANYLLGLKGNQGDLHKDVAKHLNELLDTGERSEQSSYYETEVELDHGRIEFRKCLAVTVDAREKEYSGAHLWSKLNTVAIVEATRIEKSTGLVSSERRCFISSLGCDASLILKTVRAHWSVENSLHWVLDVACGEDDSKINSKNAPRIMSALRKIGINFVKSDTETKRSFRKRQRKAAMSLDYLEKILALGLLNHS